MENLTGISAPVRPLPCVVPCKLYFALILISHLDHKMKKSDLYKNYTLHQLLDELDVIECFEDANHSLRIGELLNKQAKIYDALGVKVPTSSC